MPSIPDGSGDRQHGEHQRRPASAASCCAALATRPSPLAAILEEFVTGRATLEQALHYHGEVAKALNAMPTARIRPWR